MHLLCYPSSRDPRSDSFSCKPAKDPGRNISDNAHCGYRVRFQSTRGPGRILHGTAGLRKTQWVGTDICVYLSTSSSVHHLNYTPISLRDIDPKHTTELIWRYIPSYDPYITHQNNPEGLLLFNSLLPVYRNKYCLGNPLRGFLVRNDPIFREERRLINFNNSAVRHSLLRYDERRKNQIKQRYDI